MEWRQEKRKAWGELQQQSNDTIIYTPWSAHAPKSVASSNCGMIRYAPACAQYMSPTPNHHRLPTPTPAFLGGSPLPTPERPHSPTPLPTPTPQHDLGAPMYYHHCISHPLVVSGCLARVLLGCCWSCDRRHMAAAAPCEAECTSYGKAQSPTHQPTATYTYPLCKMTPKQNMLRSSLTSWPSQPCSHPPAQLWPRLSYPGEGYYDFKSHEPLPPLATAPTRPSPGPAHHLYPPIHIGIH